MLHQLQCQREGSLFYYQHGFHNPPIKFKCPICEAALDFSAPGVEGEGYRVVQGQYGDALFGMVPVADLEGLQKTREAKGYAIWDIAVAGALGATICATSAEGSKAGQGDQSSRSTEATLNAVGEALRSLLRSERQLREIADDLRGERLDGLPPCALPPYLFDALALLEGPDSPKYETAVQGQIVKAYLLLTCNSEAAQRFIARDLREGLASAPLDDRTEG